MEKLAKERKIMSVNQMTVYHIILEMFNILRKNSSEELKRKMLENSECQSYNLRSNQNGNIRVLDPPKISCVGFSYLGPKTWNLLPSKIKTNTNANSFKHHVKAWIWENIPFN